jgi:hypothetical protein
MPRKTATLALEVLPTLLTTKDALVVVGLTSCVYFHVAKRAFWIVQRVC